MTDVNTSEAAGETEGATVAVSKVVSGSVKDVWGVLMTTEGAEALLGPGAQFGDKGHTWRTETGRSGVIRSFHPLQQIRFSVRRDDDAPPSRVSLDLSEQDGDTLVAINHTNITSGTDPDELAARWAAALDKLQEIREQA